MNSILRSRHPLAAVVAAWWLVALAFGGATPLAAEVPVPFLAGRVVDLADMISAGAETQLDGELAALEQATGAQLAVLTVPTLEDEPIEGFALRVVESWKLGKAKQDNGVLLLIAKNDRKMRIEVGYGLEGTLPDVICKRILAERLAPRFQAGDFDGGIGEAVSVISAMVRGDENGGLQAQPESGGGGGIGGFVLVFVGMVVFNMLWPIILSAVNSKVFGWVIYPILGIPAYLVPFVLKDGSTTWGLVGLGAWLVIFPLLKIFRSHLPKPGSGSGGGWSSRGSRSGGGWSSGGGGWSSGGGGGFSGGGGSFGGGGASGNW